MVIPMLASGAVALLAFLLYASSVARLFEGRQVVEAPTVTNRSVDEASELARVQGLEVLVSDAQPTDDVAKDTVIAQVPGPGSLVLRGGQIKLTISSGLRPPSVIGRPLDQARAALVRQGWTAAPEVEARLTNEAAPDVVIEQRPAAEEVTAQKGSVKLIVAKPNVAYDRTVQTSLRGRAPEAVDGRPDTVAWVPSHPPSWVEIELDRPVNVTSVSLQAAVEEPGPATIELWAWSIDNRFFPLHLFNQEVSDTAVLAVTLNEASPSIARLRVVTTSARGPIGWREISVTDG
jgi:hypothetical protein